MEDSSLAITILMGLALVVSCSDVFSRNDFPDGFVFGSATSAYQYEGAANEDGRTPSIWDTFAHAGGADQPNGDTACDGYHKYKEDVQLMAQTGLDAYRFSISWSRLIPYGSGPVNPKGLQFYKDLINELISHGIQPHVTLSNYDLPQALEDKYGGWLSRKIIKDFTAYAEVCFKEFGNMVKFWTTINEPNIFALGGYDQGIVAPGRCSPPFGFNCSVGNSSTEPYIALHNMLLAHASAARLYEKNYKDNQHGSIGASIYTSGMVPFSGSRNDEIATQRAKDFLLGWVLHPLVFGDYPDEMKKRVGSRLPTFSDDESKLVKGSFDFIGVIHYMSLEIKDDPSLLSERDFYSDIGVEMLFLGNSSLIEYSALPWGLEGVLKYIKQSYGNPPVYILENGQAMTHNSSLHDASRVEYIHAYMGAVLNAVRNGSDTRGYFVWSFLDLYELLSGYDYGFGLYNVDFESPDLKRSPKFSAHWYSGFLKGMTVSSSGIKEPQKNFSLPSHGYSAQ